MKVYWIRREGRWTSVFITTPDLPENERGDIEGEIYNMRRKYNHKKLRLCWKNLKERSVNECKAYSFWLKTLKESFEGPFPVDWKY